MSANAVAKRMAKEIAPYIESAIQTVVANEVRPLKQGLTKCQDDIEYLMAESKKTAPTSTIQKETMMEKTPVSKAIKKPPVSKAIKKPPVSKAIKKPPASKAIKKNVPAIQKAIEKTSVSKAIKTPPVSKAIKKPPVSKAIKKPPASKAIKKPPASKAIQTPASKAMKKNVPAIQKAIAHRSTRNFVSSFQIGDKVVVEDMHRDMFKAVVVDTRPGGVGEEDQFKVSYTEHKQTLPKTPWWPLSRVSRVTRDI